jgi:hypothetical protein
MPQAFTPAAFGTVGEAVFNLTSSWTAIGTGTSGLALKERKNITIQNLGPNAIYIHTNNTDSADGSKGLQVSASGGVWSEDMSQRVQLYACCPGGTQSSPSNTRVWETA